MEKVDLAVVLRGAGMLSHTVFVCMCSHTYVFSYTGPIIYKALAVGVDLLTVLQWGSVSASQGNNAEVETRISPDISD